MIGDVVGMSCECARIGLAGGELYLSRRRAQRGKKGPPLSRRNFAPLNLGSSGDGRGTAGFPPRMVGMHNSASAVSPGSMITAQGLARLLTNLAEDDFRITKKECFDSLDFAFFDAGHEKNALINGASWACTDIRLKV